MKLKRRKKTTAIEINEDPRLALDEDAPRPEEKRGQYYFRGLYSVAIIVGAALFLRLFFLAVINGQRNTYLAEGNRIREQTIRAPRGLILDRYGKLLVQNDANYELTVIPGDLPKDDNEREELYKNIAELAALDAGNIKKLAEARGLTYFHHLLIKENLSRDLALNLETKAIDLPGFHVDINPIRTYINAPTFAHTIGYVGRVSEADLASNSGYQPTDFVGRDGIEKQYDKVLRGKNGAKIVEVDALGKVIRTIGPPREPVAGRAVYLTLDRELQEVATAALNRGLASAKKNKGTVVAIDPRNGEVLALISLPAYDNNLFSHGISDTDYQGLVNNPDQPLFFRALLGTYPSGSTIKPFVASAGLQEGIVTASTTVRSIGGLKIKEQFFPDYQASGHGYTDLKKAIAKSVNTYFYIVGGGQYDESGEKVLKQGLGIRRLKNYLKSFGFAAKTDIDLPNEAEGLIPDPEWKHKTKNFDCYPGATPDECWYVGDTYNLSIGQGDVGFTPIQMAQALSAIANGGNLYRPRVFKAREDEAGKLIETQASVTRSGFVSPENLRLVRNAMRETVVSGSARALAGLPAAGKTGTAEFGTPNKKGEFPKHAWFTSFAPYDDPRIALVVMLEGAGEGHQFAVPVAKEILDWYFKHR